MRQSNCKGPSIVECRPPVLALGNAQTQRHLDTTGREKVHLKQTKKEETDGAKT